MECQECGLAVARDANAEGWRAYRYDDSGDDEPMVLIYCPVCAEREFGPFPENERRRVCN
jgi:hypothetical protein